MTVLQEGDIQINIPSDISHRKFDNPLTHGLTCMKAVDFILDLSDRYIYIEFKDPQHPNTNVPDSNLIEYVTNIIDKSIVPKYRDTFLYEYASGRADKDIYYYVLIAIDTLDSALLTRKTDHLKQRIPVYGPQSKTWNKPFIKDCAIFNIKTWNNIFTQLPIKRIST